MEHLKYPIGRFDSDKEIKDQEISGLIAEMEMLPGNLKKAVDPLSPEQLNTPYRPGGWKVKQVVHHLVDSHMNALIRFQLALTENSPTIKPYMENRWAELSYHDQLSVNSSLELLKMIHQRLGLLLRSMNSEDLKRTYVHPEYRKVYSLQTALAQYAWHGKHHLAHITKLIERNFDKP